MKSTARIGMAVSLALGLSACGTLYKVDVTAYNNPDHGLDKTYVLLSGNPNLSVNSPEFEEFARQTERALSQKGFKRLAEDQLADAALGVYVSASIGDPAKRFHTVSRGFYERPYAENSTATVRNSGTVAGSGGRTGQQGTAISTPPPEVLSGYEENAFATTVYTKHLNLIAIDLQKYIKDIATVGRSDAVPNEIWSIDIETTGKPSELTEVVPVMLAAAQPYLANSTEDVVRVKMNGTDKRIDSIKGD